MFRFPHITKQSAPDGATYVQMVGYHSLEDAYHRLLERGEIDLPRHNFESFDLKPGEDVNFDDMNSDHFKYGTDKYDISAKLHDQQFNPVVAPDLSPTPDPAPSPDPAPTPDPAPKTE